MWKKPPPPSRKRVHYDGSENGRQRGSSKKAQKMSARERLLKGIVFKLINSEFSVFPFPGLLSICKLIHELSKCRV